MVQSTVRIDQIQSLWWQSKLGEPGQVVEDAADIGQCITVILTTPLGSVPHQPEFGANTWNYLDLPIPRATPYLVRETMAAIRRWEPRIDVDQVGVQASGVASVKISTVWTLKGSSVRQTTEVVLGG